jgi:hypothetical protein
VLVPVIYNTISFPFFKAVDYSAVLYGGLFLPIRCGCGRSALVLGSIETVCVGVVCIDFAGWTSAATYVVFSCCVLSQFRLKKIKIFAICKSVAMDQKIWT